MRRAFAETLIHVAEDDPRVIVLTGDLGFQVLDEFHGRFGPRYVNVGVAEAQLVCAASGLALEGWRPVVYSIASFMTGRPFEQIRVCVNYPALPVVIVGAGGGYTYSASGVTHHAADDLGLMSMLPNMTVVAPGDPNEVRELLPQVLQIPGPAYFRIGKFGEPVYDAVSPVLLGRARLLRQGQRVAVLTTGDIASVALKAADNLLAEEIRPVVCHMHTIKPLDTAALDELLGRVETVITVEEHIAIGGLFSAVSAWAAQRRANLKLVRLGAPDALVLGNPEREELRRRNRCDAESIAAVCRAAWFGSSLPGRQAATAEISGDGAS